MILSASGFQNSVNIFFSSSPYVRELRNKGMNL